MAALAMQELHAMNFPQAVATKRKEANEKLREARAQLDRESQLDRVMKKYDAAGNGKLDSTELGTELV